MTQGHAAAPAPSPAISISLGGDSRTRWQVTAAASAGGERRTRGRGGDTQQGWGGRTHRRRAAWGLLPVLPVAAVWWPWVMPPRWHQTQWHLWGPWHHRPPQKNPTLGACPLPVPRLCNVPKPQWTHGGQTAAPQPKRGGDQGDTWQPIDRPRVPPSSCRGFNLISMQKSISQL